MIDLPNIKEQIDMNIRKKYLAMHTSAIWQSKDGKWYTYLPNDSKPNNRVLCKRNTEEELKNVIIEFWKDQEENPTVKEVFNEWNDRKLQRKQIKAVTHTLNVSYFNRFFKEFENRKIRSISESEWEDFLCDAISDNELTAKCFSNLKGMTKGFLKRAKKRGLISMDVEHFFLEMDVSDNDFRKVVFEEEKEVFFDDEAEKIMDYIKKNMDAKNLGIALMFVTGIRIGELVGLKHEDFDGTTFKIKRTQTRYKDPQTNKYVYEMSDCPKTLAGFRTVIVPTEQKWILDKLRLCNPFGEYIFTDSKGHWMKTDMIRKRLYKVCEAVGIPKKSPHKIRKTYGSILLDNGIDNKLIQGQMGHTDIVCTERFYHRNRRKLEQKQSIIDSIPEFMVK